MQAQSKKEPVSTTEGLKLCLDAFALFGHANQELSVRRRDDIKPDLNVKFKDMARNTPVTAQFYGDNLSQLTCERYQRC